MVFLSSDTSFGLPKTVKQRLHVTQGLHGRHTGRIGRKQTQIYGGCNGSNGSSPVDFRTNTNNVYVYSIRFVRLLPRTDIPDPRPTADPRFYPFHRPVLTVQAPSRSSLGNLNIFSCGKFFLDLWHSKYWHMLPDISKRRRWRARGSEVEVFALRGVRFRLVRRAHGTPPKRPGTNPSENRFRFASVRVARVRVATTYWLDTYNGLYARNASGSSIAVGRSIPDGPKRRNR